MFLLNYEFLKKRLKASKKNATRYYELTEFLSDYITSEKYEICKAGLIPEMTHIIEESQIYLNDCNRIWIGSYYLDLCLVGGNLAEATELLIDNFKEKNFYFQKYPSFLSLYRSVFFNYSDGSNFGKKFSWRNNIKFPSFLSNIKTISFAKKEKNDSEIINFSIICDSPDLCTPYLYDYSHKLMLYSAYKQIGFEEGCIEMTKYIKTPKKIEDFPFNDFSKRDTDYYNYVEFEIKAYNEFLNGAFDNIFNPIWHDKCYKKSDQEIISEIKEVFKRYNINVD